MTTEDWENIEGLNILLEVIGETLCLLEKESNPTLPDAFPNIYILYHFIIEELNIDKELMKIAKESITKYFEINLNAEENELYIAAAFFSPKWRDFRWTLSEEDRYTMQNIAKKFCLQRIRNINSTPLYESQVDVVRRIRSNTSYGTTELDSYIDLISCTSPTSITPDTL